MSKPAIPPGLLVLTVLAFALVILPLTFLACGADETRERRTREPRERSTAEREEEREDRSEQRGILGGLGSEGSAEADL